MSGCGVCGLSGCGSACSQCAPQVDISPPASTVPADGEQNNDDDDNEDTDDEEEDDEIEDCILEEAKLEDGPTPADGTIFIDEVHSLSGFTTGGSSSLLVVHPSITTRSAPSTVSITVTSTYTPPGPSPTLSCQQSDGAGHLWTDYDIKYTDGAWAVDGGEKFHDEAKGCGTITKSL